MKRREYMRVLIFFALLCELLVIAHSPAAQGKQTLHRYVSTAGSDWKNDGSLRRPWRTIDYASTMAIPGMTIHVLPGTYQLSEIIITRTSGTAVSRIRYVSEDKWGAKLITSTTQVWQNSGAYVDIEGFDVSSSSLNTYIGIHSQGSYDRIRYNHVHHLVAPLGSCPQGAGIMLGDMQTVGQEAEGNVVHDVGPPPGGCREIHGIYDSAPGCRIINNLLFANSGMGIQLWGRPDHCILANNTIFGNGRGLVVGGDPKHGVNDYTVVANNIVYRNVDVGVYESGLSGPHNRFLRNLVFGNKTNWFLKTGSQSESITGDPLFVRYTGGLDGDYHLQNSSPCVGAGRQEFAPLADIDSRPRHAPPDVGAYASRTNADASER